MERKNKKISGFKDLDRQIFTIEDISEATKTPISTLRTWQGNGSVSPSSSFTPGRTAGRGTKALYSVFDAMQFVLMARMTKDTISIKTISECCRSDILEVVLDRLNEMADGVYHGMNYSVISKKNAYARYVFIFEKDGALYMTQEWRQWSEYGGYTFHVIDAIDMAANIFTMYNKKMGYVKV